MRRISSHRSIGEIDVLSINECTELAELVLKSRDEWTSRSPKGMFFTLGINAYMDLAQSADAQASYFGPARRANKMLRHRFAGLYDKLAQVLRLELGFPTRYAEDLAMPGFHIWISDGIPRQATASVHFDLQYQRLVTRSRYAKASGTVSFTLPIMLPAYGSSLRLWPDCNYSDNASTFTVLSQVDPEIINYHVGSAIVHSGLVLHQIGATPVVQPDDFRITLQGHGLVIGKELMLYW